MESITDNHLETPHENMYYTRGDLRLFIEISWIPLELETGSVTCERMERLQYDLKNGEKVRDGGKTYL